LGSVGRTSGGARRRRLRRRQLCADDWRGDQPTRERVL